MEFKAFCDYMKEHVKEYLPEKFQCVSVLLKKEKCGPTEPTFLKLVMPGSAYNPAIQMEPVYERYQDKMPLDMACREVAEMCNEGLKIQSGFENFANHRSQIYLTTMGVTKHKELIETIPHRTMGDIAAVCSLYLTEDGKRRVTITQDILKMYGITENRLFEIATANTERDYPATLDSLETIVKEISGIELKEDGLLYVLTNKEKLNGAAVLFYPGMCEKLAEAFPNGYYVLPSSTQECLIAPMEGYHGSITDCGEKLSAMIREINEEQFSPEEQLSDYAHVYDQAEKKIVMCKDFKARSIEHRPDRMGR